MLISKKSKYGLKALLYLARQYNQGPVLIADLAREENIPKKFLEAILLALKNGGLLHSRKGKGGGYVLGRPPGHISFGQAIRVLEGSLAPVACLSDIAYARCTECGNELTCGIRFVMKDVKDVMSTILDGTSLADVLEQVAASEDREKGVLNFSI